MKIPQRSIVYLLICLSGLLIFIFVGIMPSQKALVGLNRQIEKLQFHIEEQKSFSPLYQLLEKKIHKNNSEVLPFPARNKLSRDQIDKISATFTEIARKFNMNATSVSPDPSSVANYSEFLLINTVVRGDFSNFRNFFIGLGGILYLEHIEEIQIQQNPNWLEFKMKIWLALSE